MQASSLDTIALTSVCVGLYGWGFKFGEKDGLSTLRLLKINGTHNGSEGRDGGGMVEGWWRDGGGMVM